MGKDEISKYKKVFKNSIERKIEVCFLGKNKKIIRVTGKIIKLRKTSLRLLIADEAGVNIQFWNIRYSIFLDSSFKIKSRLYYNLHNKY